ncbi:YebC/PmpR family DNA-binding transcriptional regulator [Lentisphaerota bacterium ZTH]|nr:YebC/PmpR family DNA-binding transcriptional regulator [Lentisphaerota bacterium]WET06373.1 YebC/PmpR family DNA-binding transcriptional regulator [Lentisphaerota bacterium ZTH]
MAGHSKWANIKHKKAAADKKKGKVFSRIAKEIMVAAKMGGGDPDSNPRLRSALTSAKGVNMPNANIDRAVKKGLGELGDVVFEELTYEGYGPAGVAVLVECLTDNRNRSASEVRMVFDRSGGNLASSGAVAWMFHRKAHFVISGENADEDKLMEVVLDAGAEDIEVEDDVAEIWGAPEAFEDIMKALEDAGIATDEAAVERQPENTVELKEVKEANSVLKMIDKLEDLDDVQAVTANFEIADEIADQVEAD